MNSYSKPSRAIPKLFCGFVVLAMVLILTGPVLAKTRRVKVAMCQIFCLDGDRSGNRVRMERAVAEAKDGGAEIACFPETAILGWVNPEAHQRAFPIPGEDSVFLCGLARVNKVFICAGLAEKEENRLYDSVILIDDEGKILMKHRKVNILEELMTPAYTSGKNVTAVDTKFGRIGLLICADTFQEDLLERMSALEPDMMLVPYGWAASEEQWPEHGNELKKVVVKAARHIGAPVFGTDLVGEISHGPWTGLVYGGQSVAADASGSVLAVACDRDREILIVSVELKDER